MNTSEILAKAADLIDVRGHCKGRNEDVDGRLCTYGALRIATDEFVDAEYAFEVAAKRLGGHIGNDQISLWNDEPGRTKEEVVAKLREAARAET